MNNIPLLLKPTAKDYLWGGSRLNDDFNLGINMSPLAEAWVCSTHSDGECMVQALECSLAELLADYPDYLGEHPLQITGGKPELPILIKLIDAKLNLSVQVHPDDEYAMRNEGQMGKTEMWYVLSAHKDSKVIYGFREDMDHERIRKAVNDGSIERYLNHVPAHKDDVFSLEPGTVHAIGAGCLIAEIQESSNLTYRLYDYDRIDKNGKKRELHLEKALQVAKTGKSNTPRQPIRVLKYQPGLAFELLTRCRYFQVERMILNTENRKLAYFKTGTNSFHALLCLDGCGVLFGDGFMLNFYKGDCIFVPAESAWITLHGRAQLLNVSC